MSPNSVPTMRRSQCSSSDPYDQAEGGFGIDLGDISNDRPSPEPQRAHSVRYLRRGSNSTLVDASSCDIVDVAVKPLPQQEERCHHTSLWGSRLYQAFCGRRKSQNSYPDAPDAPQDDRREFRFQRIRSYPDGWPKLAEFMESSVSFGIYRRFGHIHARLLAIHMREITSLENKLSEIDSRDEIDIGVLDTDQKFNTKHFDDLNAINPERRELIEKLEKNLIAYDDLLLKYSTLKTLTKTPARDHNHLSKWIWRNKRSEEDKFNWLSHPDDFISLVPSYKNRLEECILQHLDRWPDSCLKKLFQASKQLKQHPESDSAVEEYGTARMNIFARLFFICFGVLVLFIPIILFLLISMSRECMVVVVMLFMFVFAAVMGLLTDAGEKEILFGTAAYAAVLVVFLGNLQKGDGNSAG